MIVVRYDNISLLLLAQIAICNVPEFAYCTEAIISCRAAKHCSKQDEYTPDRTRLVFSDSGKLAQPLESNNITLTNMLGWCSREN